MIYLLHISDLHLVVNPLWNNMKEAICRAVSKKLQNVPQGQKLLVITGDFHNFVDHNFDQAKTFLLQLFNAMEIDPSKDVFVVPGNHDVSKNMVSPQLRENAIAYVQQHPDKLLTRMDTLLSCYDGYLDFLRNIKIYAEGTALNPVSVHVRNWRNKLNILHLNTTLIADGISKTEQMTDTTTATSDEVKDLLRKNHLPCLALGHNSFFDLAQSQRNQLSAMFLHANISAYLCGDRHVINTKNVEKVISLGEKYGAPQIPNIVSYRSSADETDTYSDFGMIWHIWDETSGKVFLQYMRWDPDDQGELKLDGVEEYSFRERLIPRYITDNSWLSNEELMKRGSRLVTEWHIKNFLLGYRNNCNLWGLAFSDRIVHREIAEDLYNLVLRGGIYALTGSGGEGKSTVLMQLCVKLVTHQIPVFYYRGHSAPRLPEAFPERSVFVLDSPPDTPAFKKFLDDAIDRACTLILGVRENEWNLMKRSLEIPDSSVCDIPMTKVTLEEAEQFAGCICDHLYHSRSKEEIKYIFTNNSYGFLYAAMLLSVSDQNTLEDIAHQIIEKLSNRFRPGLILLGSVVLSERYEIKFIHALFQDFCKHLHIPPRDVTRALSREVLKNGDKYQTRHMVISHLFYQELFSDRGYLCPDEVSRIFTDLMEFFLNRYRALNGYLQSDAWNSIMRLCRGLALADLDTQQYIIDRILDEVRSKSPKTFYLLPSFFEQEELRQLFYRRCFDRDLFLTSFLREWCDLLLKDHILWTDSDPYAPAQIFREACVNKKADSDAWLAWAQLKAKESGSGDYETEYTARWIFREACVNRNASGHVWLAWAQLEAKESGPGDYETEYTARWIFQEACVNRNADSQVWLAWAQLEAKESGPGDYETEYTARWIFREACVNRNADGQVWLAWAQLEAKESGPGDYETEYTARWIFREACVNRNADGQVWLAWAQLEAKESGPGDYGTKYTARWIFREACVNKKADSNAWLAWAQLETKESGPGDYGTEYTAHWIFREACVNRNADGQVWLAWAQLEAKKSGLGDYGTEYTAHWIFREACVNRNADGHVWLAWAQLEAKESGPGDYGTEYTARWIFQEACVNRNADGQVWLAWAQLEAKESGPGDYETEHTARWIFQEGTRRYPDFALIYFPYACLELSQKEISYARAILRNALQYSDFSIGALAILEFFCGNIDSENGYCVNQLIKRMRANEESSFGAVRHLYYCMTLLGKMEDAQRYQNLLLHQPSYDRKNKAIEDYIHLCQMAVSREADTDLPASTAHIV